MSYTCRKKILLCFQVFFWGTTLHAPIFSSKWTELLLSYLPSHAYKEGKKPRSITREPWLCRNKGHKKEFLRYRQLSKLSSALSCAAVFVLCFLNLYTTSYNRRVKIDFLLQRTQAVFLKDCSILAGKWNSRGKKRTWSTHRATSYIRLFWQISLGKTPIRNSSIPIVSTDFSHSIYWFLSRYYKDSLTLQEQSQLTFWVDSAILVWIQQGKSNAWQLGGQEP